MPVLGLDVGTTFVRAAIYDDSGACLSPARGRRQHGAADDPERLVAEVAEVLAEARRGAGSIDAVGVACFWHSLLVLDSAGRPLTPLLGWRGAAAADDADRLAAVLDAAAVHARTGCPLHASFWPAKLAWLRRTNPDVLERAARLVSFAEYLLERRAGAATMSLSAASATGLLELRRRDWDNDLLEVLALPRELLPKLSDEPVGGDEPWYPPIGDGACANLGAGAVTPERAALTIGTSAALRVVRPLDASPVPSGLFRYFLDAERAVQGGALSDGGNLFYWLRDVLRLDDGEFEDVEPDEHGLTFLPLLGGERSTGWNAHARGAITGLTFGTSAHDLFRAALEGAALRVAAVAELMPEVRQVVATGGAMARNQAWVQLVADALGLPVAEPDVQEASERGAAVYALERLGRDAEPPRIVRVHEPRPERTAKLRLALERQRALYDVVN